jgi:hypothetical protein
MSRRILALAALMTLTTSATRADLMIDDFNTGPQQLEIPGGTGSTTASIFSPDVLGSIRVVTLGVTANPLDRAATAVVTGNAPGFLSLSSGEGVDSFASLLYDDGGAGLNGFDLTLFGSQFTVDLDFISPTATLGVTVVDAFDQTASVLKSGLTSGLVGFTFASFAGVDLTSVESITLTFDGPTPDFDVVSRLNSFAITQAIPIPEPASAFLMGLGVLGSVAALRRRATRR